MSYGALDRALDDAHDAGLITEVLRPSAVVPEETAREILIALSRLSVHADGCWLTESCRWSRYDRPWSELDQPGEAGLVGTIQVTYGTPRRYDITIYRVSVTARGSSLGWSVFNLADEALGFCGLSLAGCPRTTMPLPLPRPFRF